jgi:hypothetical protein
MTMVFLMTYFKVIVVTLFFRSDRMRGALEEKLRMRPPLVICLVITDCIFEVLSAIKMDNKGRAKGAKQ